MSHTKAIVLVNLGTPERPDPAAVRAFLREFLSDPRVVEIPRPIWLPILYGFILTTRPRAVAEAYKTIWTEQGSPLRAITEQQTADLQQHLQAQTSFADTSVHYAMSYGQPSLPSVIAQLQAQGIERIGIIPLYPQYSATTTAVVYDQLAKIQLASREIADTRVCKSYYQRPAYIKALAASVRAHWAEQGQAERLLMSFHGIPKRCVDLGDPYYQHCMATAKNVAAELQLDDEQWAISFQSRLGKAEWLKPYTVELVEQWGKQGLASMDVICPAFAADCLETLEEISGEVKEEFQHAGGGEFRYIPCLNSNADHIELLADISRGLLAD
ncbi:MAG: ferrochelatase [Cellvibrionaceae bacterium]|nr:ferrochelatase [Cellvibrionaceae bacterium]